MAQYRDNLPQLSGDLFVTDGGIETTLIYLEKLDLPYFAAFDLLKDETGQAALRNYFRGYAALARQFGVGCILESATWRASADWGEKLGYSTAALAEANRRAIELLHDIRQECASAKFPMVISGCVGPRGDGYNPQNFMTAAEAERYHAPQVESFRAADADMVTAITMTYPEEAIGIVRAVQNAAMPVAISFTVETDGRLPNGQSLKEGIEQVDLATGAAPAYYMINCAHPSHFADVLDTDVPWTARIHGLRANASTKSHAELDQASELDRGDPTDLAARYRELKTKLKNLNVLGGCCGTDQHHIEAICRAMISGE